MTSVLGNIALPTATSLSLSLPTSFPDTAARFKSLCEEISVAQYCLDPTKVDKCCGICPNGGISSVLGQISVGLNALASVWAISLAPKSAPGALTLALIQANAYAATLLGKVLFEGGGKGGIDRFHAAYALMLSMSSLIPITAIAASPSYAITGDDSPKVKRAKRRREMLARRQEMIDAVDRNPDLDEKEREELLHSLRNEDYVEYHVGGGRGFLDFSPAYTALFIGFGLSLLLWAAAWVAAFVMEGRLAQENCMAEMIGASSLNTTLVVLWLLGLGLFVMTLSRAAQSEASMELSLRDNDDKEEESMLIYNFAKYERFGLAMLVWTIWMLASSYSYYRAATSVLLWQNEMQWGFGTIFGIMMLIVPVYGIITKATSADDDDEDEPAARVRHRYGRPPPRRRPHYDVHEYQGRRGDHHWAPRDDNDSGAYVQDPEGEYTLAARFQLDYGTKWWKVIIHLPCAIVIQPFASVAEGISAIWAMSSEDFGKFEVIVKR